MTTAPEVSVVTPTRHQWEPLRRSALPAAFRQQDVQLESVVDDDGSTDVIVKTDLARQFGGFDRNLTLLADWDFWLRLALATTPAPCSVHVGYLSHGGNMALSSAARVFSRHALYRREVPRPEPDRRNGGRPRAAEVGRLGELLVGSESTRRAHLRPDGTARRWPAGLRSRAALSHLGSGPRAAVMRPLAAPQSRRRACGRQGATRTALVARRGSDPSACRSFVMARFGLPTQGSLPPRDR